VEAARLRAGRRANGTPIQLSKTIRAPGASPKPGAGTRLADRELAKLIAKVDGGRVGSGSKTLGELLGYVRVSTEEQGKSGPRSVLPFGRHVTSADGSWLS